MSVNTLSGGASILMDRWIRKVFGFMAARMRTSATKTAMTMMTLKIMQ